MTKPDDPCRQWSKSARLAHLIGRRCVLLDRTCKDGHVSSLACDSFSSYKFVNPGWGECLTAVNSGPTPALLPVILQASSLVLLTTSELLFSFGRQNLSWSASITAILRHDVALPQPPHQTHSHPLPFVPYTLTHSKRFFLIICQTSS
jgi:hypothetical protein